MEYLKIFIVAFETNVRCFLDQYDIFVVLCLFASLHTISSKPFSLSYRSHQNLYFSIFFAMALSFLSLYRGRQR